MIWVGGGSTIGAHRVAWELTHGSVAAGLVVRHKVCDNPPCCNVDHLEVGTHADNVADRVGKGRSARGEAIGYAFRGALSNTAKMTDEIVLECRLRSKAGEHYNDLGAEFGVAGNVMRQAIRGKGWSHLDPATVDPGCGRKHPPSSRTLRLTEAMVIECRARRVCGEKMLRLAKEFGVDYATLRQAIVGETWKHVPMP